MLGGFFGFVSPSCSFAALAASRSVQVKRAHQANAVALLIASTNLVIELGIVLLAVLSSQFVVGHFALSVLMIVCAYGLSGMWLAEGLAGHARAHLAAAIHNPPHRIPIFASIWPSGIRARRARRCADCRVRA